MESSFLLDTNAASDLFKNKSDAARDRWVAERTSGNRIAISVLTHAELIFGFAQNPAAVRLRAAYDNFLSETDIVPWTAEASVSYAHLRMVLKSRTLVIDTMDLLIGSQAHALGAMLVTRDHSFRHLSDQLAIENWATDLR